jgi:hypothetical protein
LERKILPVKLLFGMKNFIGETSIKIQKSC